MRGPARSAWAVWCHRARWPHTRLQEGVAAGGVLSGGHGSPGEEVVPVPVGDDLSFKTNDECHRDAAGVTACAHGDALPTTAPGSWGRRGCSGRAGSPSHPHPGAGEEQAGRRGARAAQAQAQRLLPALPGVCGGAGLTQGPHRHVECVRRTRDGGADAANAQTPRSAFARGTRAVRGPAPMCASRFTAELVV